MERKGEAKLLRIFIGNGRFTRQTLALKRSWHRLAGNHL